MGSRRSKLPPDPSEPDQGIYHGRSIAHRFRSKDGWIILVGRTAADNDLLSLKLANQRDFWLHVAGQSGSHVVVRNPEGLSRLPRETKRLAAALAARYSKARAGGRVAVHLCRCRDVSKPRGAARGKVSIGRFETVQASPLSDQELEDVRESPDRENTAS